MNAHYHALDLSPKYTCTRWDHAQSHSFTGAIASNSWRRKWLNFLAIFHSPHFITVKDGIDWAEERVMLQASHRCFMCHFHGEKCWWCMPSAHKSKSTLWALFSKHMFGEFGHYSAWLPLPFTEFLTSVCCLWQIAQIRELVSYLARWFYYMYMTSCTLMKMIFFTWTNWQHRQISNPVFQEPLHHGSQGLHCHQRAFPWTHMNSSTSD